MGDKIGGRRSCQPRTARHAAIAAPMAALIAAAIALIGAARAGDYPSRSIRVIIPFGPGGVTDIVSRVVFDAMAKVLGQPMVIENRPGASGTIGDEFVADAPPDGYTLLVNDPSGPLATGVSLYPSRHFDPTVRLEPIALFGTTGAVLVVSANFPAKTLADLVALAKQEPGELLYGSTGLGTPGHLNGALFNRIAGIDARHVPYRVGSQGVTDLISGRLSFWIIPLPAVLAYIQNGQLRALAAAGAHRLRDLPDVPTVAESGFGNYDVSTMYALFAPRGTPADIAATLRRATDQVLALDDVRQRLAKAGVEPLTGSAELVGTILNAKIDQWAEVIRAAGIAPE
jgi:tripartite-type tricarboxylate transporter receptor subunit TctC